ncbi:hypothetical protein AU381_21730 [Sinorhizobium glycinis]|uniref:Transmembrane protein n=1 Tax=Sinorhizobium glycinis TaxID=1472378 RepID=A0A178XSF9_9HYPH|nr:hypothetical protein [Sinorhizobium glycinis]OAP38210.1 hypothetical protein AU381_21730 [Sinorhizobium glycinis]
MFLDDEIASTRTGRKEARCGVYLALAALAVCMVMIFGLVVEATAQAAETKREQQSGAEAKLVTVAIADPASAAPTASAGLDRPQMRADGDRQILVGTTLLAAALTAGTTFVAGHQIAAFSRARSRRHGR